MSRGEWIEEKAHENLCNLEAINAEMLAALERIIDELFVDHIVSIDAQNMGGDAIAKAKEYRHGMAS